MPKVKAPLFVRLPKGQIDALDRWAGQTGRPKQHLVSELLADRLGTGGLALGRVEVSPALERGADDVLTVEGAAALLKVTPDAVEEAIQHGHLPARRFGREWRFSRSAVLDWLGQGDRTSTHRITARRP